MDIHETFLFIRNSFVRDECTFTVLDAGKMHFTRSVSVYKNRFESYCCLCTQRQKHQMYSIEHRQSVTEEIHVSE